MPKDDRPRPRTADVGELDAPSTRSLVRRVRLGDLFATQRLFDRLMMTARRWAHGRLPRRTRQLTDTADVAQEVMLKAWRNLDRVKLERPGDLEAYIRQASANRLNDEMRRAQRMPEMTELDSTVPADLVSPLQQAMSAEEWGVYQAALTALSDEERTAVIARVEDGKSHAEIALLIGKPSPAAARMTINRAVTKLSKALDGSTAPPQR